MAEVCFECEGFTQPERMLVDDERQLRWEIAQPCVNLLQRARKSLRVLEVARKADVEIVRVPGAWEIPSAARTLAESKRFDAIVTLGCLLRGETAHYEAIYTEVARGIGQSQQETGVPHAFGVLTCETLEQALDRAGVKAGNKGFEAAIAAIEMVSIQRKIRAGESGD